MKIKSIKSQHRRDMQLELECEHCGDISVDNGYDDEHFHQVVIPNMVCIVCGKTASEDYRPLQPKYSPNQVV